MSKDKWLQAVIHLWSKTDKTKSIKYKIGSETQSNYLQLFIECFPLYFDCL